jgi:hypothetical protein
MTVAEAIAFHVKNWNFEKDFETKKMHDFAHQILAIATIYDQRLQKYRIQSDSETKLMKAQGYNGFLEAEFLAISIQTIIEKLSRRQRIRSLFDAIKVEGIAITKYYYGYIFEQNDIYFWLDAERSDKPQSLFEAKYFQQFALNPPRSYRNIGIYMGMPNKHGEVLRKYEIPNDIEIAALAKMIENFIYQIDVHINSNDINGVGNVASFLYGLNIRDLHRLIGGDEAAEEYFRTCGIPENEIEDIFANPVSLSRHRGTKKAAAIAAAP